MNSKYYIVALDKECKIIFLDNAILKEDKTKLTKLPYLDLITSKYSEEAIRNYLFNKKLISHKTTPLYIVKKYNYKGKEYIKFHNIIYKGMYDNLVTNIALTELRNRNITITECGYLLGLLEEKYISDQNFKEITQEVINIHDIKHLLLHKNKMKAENYENDNQRYGLLRDVVSCLQLSNKYSSALEYFSYDYGKIEFSDNIVEAINKFEKNLPDDYKIDENSEQPKEELLDESTLKHLPWDSERAKQDFINNYVSIENLRTLTLEDRYRAGLISYYEYCKYRNEALKKVKKTSKKG